jgi:hypothetical protein
MLSIPIISSIIEAGKVVLDKFWMDKGEKEKLELTKEELKQQFSIIMEEMNQTGKLANIDKVFREHQAQRQFANDQFGTAKALKEFGWVGKVVMLGRASIRWVITGGSMFFTWKILNSVLTDSVIAGIAGGSLGGASAYIVGLLIVLVIGIPLFYVSGISVEKIMGRRNKL